MATKGHGGQILHKTIKVYTNDPKNKIIELKLSGKVDKFVTIKPNKVKLSGRIGENISQTVTIIPETKEPFKILKATAMKGIDFSYSLKEVTVKGKRAYELTVTNVKKTPGRYYDKMVILTDRTEHKPLDIIVIGELSPADPGNHAPEKAKVGAEPEAAVE